MNDINNINVIGLDSVNETQIMLKCLEMKTNILIALLEYSGKNVSPVKILQLEAHLKTIDALLFSISNKV